MVAQGGGGPLNVGFSRGWMWCFSPLVQDGALGPWLDTVNAVKPEKKWSNSMVFFVDMTIGNGC